MKRVIALFLTLLALATLTLLNTGSISVTPASTTDVNVTSGNTIVGLKKSDFGFFVAINNEEGYQEYEVLLTLRAEPVRADVVDYFGYEEWHYDREAYVKKISGGHDDFLWEAEVKENRVEITFLKNGEVTKFVPPT